MSKHGWLTPDEIPEATTCRSLLIPDDVDILACVSGALLPLTKSYNWEKFGTVEPEEIAAAMQAMYLQWLQDACASGGEIPAPFWDDPDADDSEIELPPEEQPWYEELSHWIIAGFLAITFTPAAGLFYITTIRAARIAFRARDYGAVAEILIDGVMHDSVDTFSTTDGVIFYDLNIPTPGGFSAQAFDPVTVEIRHSGEHNAAATPTADGYAIEVIRDYFGRDTSGAPVSRINPDDGTFEISTDGGETWTPNPNADPRRQILFPPLTGGDVRCDAAASIVRVMHDRFDEFFANVALGTSVISGAFFLIALFATLPVAGLVGLFFGGSLAAIATFFATYVIDTGATTVSNALTNAQYDKLRCIFLALVDANGRMPEANMVKLYAAIYQEMDATAAQALDLFFDFVGFGGLSNFAAVNADPGGACNCCDDRSEDFTGGAKWFTTIGANGIFPANESGGVWSATGGRTAAACAISTVNGASSQCVVMIDLGKDCTIDSLSWWYRMSAFVGGTPATRRIWYVTQAGVVTGNISNPIGAPTTYTNWTRFDTAQVVRYVILQIACPAAYQTFIDDIVITLH